MNWLQKNKVFIGGLILALISSVLSILTPQTTEFNWYIIGWNVLLAGLTYAGNKLRAQAASIAATLQASLSGFFLLNQSPEDITRPEIVILILSMTAAVLGIFFSSPAKTMAYEKTPTMEKAKEQEQQIIKEEKKAGESPAGSFLSNTPKN